MRARARIASTAALLAVGSLALAGCASASAADEPGTGAAGTLPTLGPDDQVDITFESYNLASAGIWGSTINDMLDEFMRLHPNIHVTGQPTQSAATAASVQQELLAGNAPDVAQITFDSIAYAISDLGAVDLTRLVGADGLAEEFGGEYPYNANAKVLADQDGSTYGLPYVFSTPVLWVNESMLQQAGVDPATVDLSTWDKVAAVAKQVSDSTGKPSMSITCLVAGGNWCMQALFKSNGAAVLSDDRTTIEFGSAAAIDTVQTFRDMYTDGVLINEGTADMYTNFAKGDEVFHVDTSALQATFMAGAKAGGWTLNATTLPAFGTKPVVPTNSGSALMMFSTDPKKQAAAWELMKYFTSPDAYQVISTQIGYLPLRSTMATQPGGPLYDWVQANPLVKPNLQQLDQLQPWVSYPGPEYAQVDTILAAAIENSIFQGADVQKTMTDVAARAQGMIQ